MQEAPYTAAHALAFRRFAIRELQRPGLDLAAGPTDPAQDILKLSLLSVRDFMARGFHTRRADGTAFEVFPGYVDSLTPNAFAAIEDGVHLCGLHVGLAASCLEFALFCLAQPILFPEIGDAASEAAPASVCGYPPGFWTREAGAGLDPDHFVRSIQPLVPRDPDRYQTALLLTVLMTRFIWFHELYHGLNGHIGYAAAEHQALFLHERDLAAPTGIPTAELRRLEMDADKSALFAVCQVQVRDGENVEGIARWPLAFRLQLGLFGAYALVWMIEEYGRRNPDGMPVDRSSHPIPYHRLHGLIRMVASNIAPQVRDMRDIHNAVLSGMDALTALLPSFPAGTQLVSDMRDPCFQAVLEAEQLALESLRPRLDPYRFS